MHRVHRHISNRISSAKLFLPALALASLILFQTCSSSKKATREDKGITEESVIEHVEPERANSSTRKGAGNATDTLNMPKAPVSDSVFVEMKLREMTLREKIGQLFFIPAYGSFQNNDEESYQDILSMIKDYHVGGLIFFSGNIYGQAILTNKLQDVSETPLWITQDMEFGAAMRVSEATRIVPAMAVAATQNPDYAYWAGKITAREAKALGVNQVFAPVLDVNNNPDNPVINVRSFSGDPRTVAIFGQRFIDGVESEGLVATAKHFPGHGDTGTDSHISLPVINASYARLDSIELVPFRSAINHGLKSIMSAHIAFPQISDTPELPGTMNAAILNRILRDSLQFNGLVVTDGLEMNGIASNYSPGRVVVQSLKAGADLMLLSPDAVTAMHEVEQAVRYGSLTESRIDTSVRKLLLWKKQHGLFKDDTVDINKLSTSIHSRENRLIADEISRKSLTLVKNKGDILPIRATDYPKILVVSVADDKSGSTGSYLSSMVRNYHPDVMFHVFDKRSSQEEKSAILRDARRADLIILGTFIYVRSGQKVQLSSDQLRFLNKLPSAKPSVLVAFGNPYVVQDLPETDVQMMAWAANSDQIRNAVPALFGASKVTGRLPIKIPGMYAIGDGIELPHTTVREDHPETVGLSSDSLRKVDRIMQDAIFDSTFPGGVVAVVKDGVIAQKKAYGYYTYDKVEKVNGSAIYDLASLTKIVATTTSVMKLVDEGKIDLDDKVSAYIPEFGEGEKSTITLRNLLLHNSGLPAFRVYVDKIQKESELIEAIKNEPLINKPGAEYVYSDLGLILLGEIIEKVTGMPLDRYVRKTFYYPMGMSSTFFNPSKVGRWIKRRIPPTERDTVFRNKLMQGEVHDERAYYLNGVAGHAGLFSNASDLAIYAQMLMNGGSYGGQQYLKKETIDAFTSKQENSERGIGFDIKNEEGFSTAGALSSPRSYGHTGFTGTSMWIDPERDIGIIILTNRVYPYRSYGKNISQIRAAVADAVISSIIE